MNPIKNITVPQPCHQSWNKMTPNSNGRHCADCCKTVLDFSLMTNDEIMGYLSNHQNVCGRFGDQQISALDREVYIDNLSGNNWWKRAAIIAGMLGSMALWGGAQTKPTITNTVDTTKIYEPQNYTMGKVIATTHPPTARLIKGTITGNDDRLPIPGVSITIKGTTLGTATNTAGKFVISVPANYQTLAINLIGYNKQEINITDEAEQTCNVTMAPIQYLTGEVVIVKKYSLPHRLWFKTKRFFKKSF